MIYRECFFWNDCVFASSGKTHSQSQPGLHFHFVTTLRRLFRPPLFAIACALCSAVLLHAQNAGNTGGGTKPPELKAAQKPKSDKWTFSFLPVGLQRNPEIDYTIITEMTDDGRKLPAPSFDKPVYYISHSVGQRDVGDSYGGTKTIQYNYLEKQLGNALASNGYRLADETHPATQLLFIAWGMHNKIDNTDDDSADSADSGDGEVSTGAGVASFDNSMVQNLLSRAKIVGGQKFAGEFARALSEQLVWTSNLNANGPLKRFAERDDITEALVYEIMNECYYLLVTSLDVDALKQNRKKILWTTKISTTSQGIAFESTLPNMISNGAYYFGREMSGPDIIRKRAYKRGSVDIGEATVVEYMTGASGTTVPAPTPAASGTATGNP